MTDQNDLSQREREILALVAKGASNKEIASELHISTNTVKVHLRNIFSKIDANSRTEAAMYAVNSGLVDIGGNGSARVAQTQPLASNRTLIFGVGSIILLIIISVIGFFTVRGMIGGDQAETNQPVLEEDQRWQEKTPMSEARKGLALAGYGGEVFAIAGETDQEITGLVERYDPVQDMWSILDPKPVPVTDISAAVIRGKIYIPGGRTSDGEQTDILEIYSPLDGVWEKGANLPVGLSAYAIVSYEGNLYVFGGWDGTKYLNNVYEYNPERDEWREMTPMSTPRAFAGAAVAGGQIYVLGGYDGKKGLSSMEIYIPELENSEVSPWKESVPLPTSRYGMGVVGLGNMIHIVGGEIGKGGSQSSLVYLPQDRVWQEFESPEQQALTNFGLVPMETQLYSVGGQLGENLTAKNSEYQALFTFVMPIIR